MRDILFKNITSVEKKRKIIATTEVADKEGVRSIIKRHFVYMVKEAKTIPAAHIAPFVYIRKERDTRLQREKFFCKIKGSTYVHFQKKIFSISYMHTLTIALTAISEGIVKY